MARFIFSFYPEAPLSQQIFTGADSELGSDRGLGAAAQRSTRKQLPYCSGFSLVGESMGEEVSLQ